MITHVTNDYIMGRCLLLKPHDIKQHHVTTHVVRAYSLDINPFSLNQSLIPCPVHCVHLTRRTDLSSYEFMHTFFFEVIDRVIEQLWLVPRYQTCDIRRYNWVHHSRSGRINLQYAAKRLFLGQNWVFKNQWNRKFAWHVITDVSNRDQDPVLRPTRTENENEEDRATVVHSHSGLWVDRINTFWSELLSWISVIIYTLDPHLLLDHHDNNHNNHCRVPWIFISAW